MNYTTDQILNGLISYADLEIMDKLPTSGKWIAGTAIGLMTRKADHVIEMIRDNTIVNMLGIIDENGDIDVDTLTAAMKQSADKYGKLTVDIPMIGRLSFTSADIDTLRTCIR